MHEAIAPRGRIGYADFVVRHEKLRPGKPGRLSLIHISIERRPMLEGRHMIMILAPKAEKKSFAEKSQQRKEKHAAAQAAKASEPEKRELKPQPKKKVKRESENMI